MPVIRTDLRNTRESAERIRFEPGGGVLATNVQDAIMESATTIPSIDPTTVTSAMSPYLVQNTDTLLWVDTSLGPVEIDLSTGASRAGRTLEIKDITGNAAVNPITLDPQPAETVDGMDPYPIDINFGGATLYPKPAGGWTTQP